MQPNNRPPPNRPAAPPAPTASMVKRTEEANLTPAERQHQNLTKQLGALVAARSADIATAARGMLTPEYLLRILATALASKPQLLSCTPTSILRAAMDAVQLGLVPETPAGEAYLIPRGGKVVFQVGRTGWMKLAQRSGKLAGVIAEAVCVGDTWSWDPARGEVKHTRGKRVLDSRGKVQPIAAYARLMLRDGVLGPPVVLDEQDIERIRNFVAKNNGGKLTPMWHDWPDRAVERSALVRLVRTRAVLDADVHEALAHEDDGEGPVYDAELVPLGSVELPAEASPPADEPPTYDAQPSPPPEDEEPPPYGEPMPPPARPAAPPPPAAPQGGATRATLLKLLPARGWTFPTALKEIRGTLGIGHVTDEFKGLEAADLARCVDYFTKTDPASA